MPTRDTTVIAVRAPRDIVEAVRSEARRRGITVNELMNLRLAADFSFVRKVSGMDKNGRDADELIVED